MTYDDRPTRATALRRFTGVVAIALFGAAIFATSSFAGGGKFEWPIKGQRAAMQWMSFIDNEAYLTSSSNARQRKGGRGMYQRYIHNSLRCSGGGQSCVSFGAGGASVGEGAEFHADREIRHRPNLPRRYGQKKVASTRLNLRSQLMRADHLLCLDISTFPDKCSVPRVALHTYDASGKAR